ncbi:hypothetical protein B4Q13_19110 [Lacticaseibacillus rhamnosus]
MHEEARPVYRVRCRYDGSWWILHVLGSLDVTSRVRFLDEAQLEWCGFFAYSAEQGTYAEGLDGAVDKALVQERRRELSGFFCWRPETFARPSWERGLPDAVRGV